MGFAVTVSTVIVAMAVAGAGAAFVTVDMESRASLAQAEEDAIARRIAREESKLTVTSVSHVPLLNLATIVTRNDGQRVLDVDGTTLMINGRLADDAVLTRTVVDVSVTTLLWTPGESLTITATWPNNPVHVAVTASNGATDLWKLGE